MVPKDALGLKVVGCGDQGANLILKARVILRDLNAKDAPPCWIGKGVVDT